MTAALIAAHPAAADTVAPPTFSQYQLYPTALLPRYVATGDVNGDGRTDVVMVAGTPAGDARATAGNTLVVFTQLPGGSLAQAYALPVDDSTAGSVGVAVGDLDGDGAADAVVAVPAGLALFYQRDGVLQSGGLVAGAPADERTVAIADMNGDGLPDLVAATGTDTFVLTRRADGGYDDPRYVGDLPLDTRIAVGDLNGDGRPDIAGMAGNYDVQLLMQGGGGFFAQRTIPADSIWDMAVGDATGDGRPDVVVGTGNSDLNSAVEVFPQEAGAGISQTPATHPTSQIPFALAAGDLNADHTLDVAVLQAFNGRVGAFAQSPDGSLGKESLAPAPYQASFTPGSIAMGDLTGDGKPDLAVASGGDAPQGLVVVPQGPPVGGTPELFPSPSAPPTGPSAGPLPYPGPIVITSPPVDSSHPNGGKPTRFTSRGLTNAGAYERFVAPRSRCRGSSSTTATPAVLERAFTCLLAYARHRAGMRPAVRTNRRLADTAALKVKAILHCQEFDHNACGTPWARLFRRTGYLRGHMSYRIGETIAYASDWAVTPRGILRVWLESPAHRRNLLDPRWRDVGVSIAHGRLQRMRVAVWALEFGARGRR
jgi:uncharacterized protein YkwD